MLDALFPERLTKKVIACSANSFSTNQCNNDPGGVGITSIVGLRAGKGGSEQIIRHSSQNVRCIQHHRVFPDAWGYTCYAPRDSEKFATPEGSVLLELGVQSR